MSLSGWCSSSCYRQQACHPCPAVRAAFAQPLHGLWPPAGLPQGHSLVVADVGDSLAVLGREENDEYVGDIGELLCCAVLCFSLRSGFPGAPAVSALHYLLRQLLPCMQAAPTC